MKKQKPPTFKWALPRKMDVPPDHLELRLDFFQESTVMHVYENGVVITKVVSADEIARALTSELTLSSGLLPENALWWAKGREGPEIAIWERARVWKVALVTEPLKPPLRYEIPMPGLVFICRLAADPRVFAAKRRPQSSDDMLFAAPCFNVFGDGRVCPGTHRWPLRLSEIPSSFFESYFSAEAGLARGRSQKYPDDLRGLWEELNGQKRYPLHDLMQFGKVESLL